MKIVCFGKLSNRSIQLRILSTFSNKGSASLTYYLSLSIVDEIHQSLFHNRASLLPQCSLFRSYISVDIGDHLRPQLLRPSNQECRKPETKICTVMRWTGAHFGGFSFWLPSFSQTFAVLIFAVLLPPLFQQRFYILYCFAILAMFISGHLNFTFNS